MLSGASESRDLLLPHPTISIILISIPLLNVDHIISLQEKIKKSELKRAQKASQQREKQVEQHKQQVEQHKEMQVQQQRQMQVSE